MQLTYLSFKTLLLYLATVLFIYLMCLFVQKSEGTIRQLFSAVFVAFTMASRPPLKVSLSQQIDTNIFILFAPYNKVIFLLMWICDFDMLT